jgi:hypothetical protein
MIKMKRTETWITAFALILILLGVMLVALSSLDRIRKIRDTGENGTQYVVTSSGENGTVAIETSLKRYYQVGEKITLDLTFAPVNPTMPAVPELLPFNFSIISPNDKQTWVTFWLAVFRNSQSGAIQGIGVDELDWGGEGLNVENTSATASAKSFIGDVAEDGNYTLTFTDGALAYIRLTYLGFVKLILETEYPFTLLLPLGITFVIISALSGLWVFRTSKNRRSIRRVKSKNSAK